MKPDELILVVDHHLVGKQLQAIVGPGLDVPFVNDDLGDRVPLDRVVSGDLDVFRQSGDELERMVASGRTSI